MTTITTTIGTTTINEGRTTSHEPSDPETPILGPGCRGYVRTSAMEADGSLAARPYGEINTRMRRFGFDYTAHPNCTGGYGGDIGGVHGDVDGPNNAEEHQSESGSPP